MKNIKILSYLIFIIILSLNLSVYSKNNEDLSIKGKIVDQNKDAVPFAEIKIGNYGIMFCDEQGKFDFPLPKEYFNTKKEVLVTCVNYLPFHKDVLIVHDSIYVFPLYKDFELILESLNDTINNKNNIIENKNNEIKKLSQIIKHLNHDSIIDDSKEFEFVLTYSEDKIGLKAQKTIKSPQLFTKIISIDSNYFKLKDDKYYYFCLKNNLNSVAGPFSSIIEEIRKNIFLVTLENKKGLFSTKTFKSEIPCLYDEITHLNENYFKVKNNGKFGLYEIYKGEILESKFSSITPISENLFSISLRNNSGLWDKRVGRMIISFSPIYKNFQIFSETLIKITNNDDKKGLFDIMKSEIVLPFEYDDLYKLSTNYLVYKKDTSSGLIDYMHFTKITHTNFTKISMCGVNNFIVTRNNKMGIINNKNRILVDFKYIELKESDNNLLLFKENNPDYYGLLDIKKGVILPEHYLNIQPFKMTLYNERNQYKNILTFMSKYIGTYLNNRSYFMCKKSEGYGIIDDQETTYLPCEYDSIIPYPNYNYILLKKSNKYGYRNLSGTVFHPPSFYECEFINELYAKVKLQINEENHNATNSKYYSLIKLKDSSVVIDSIDNLSIKNEYIIVVKSQKYSVYNLLLKPITNKQYDEISFENKTLMGYLKESGNWVQIK